MIPCSDQILDLLPRHLYNKNEAAEEIVRLLAYELCKFKADVELIPTVMDIESCPPQYLPLIANILGINNFPHLATEWEQRRFIRFAMEALRYKGLRYGLEFLFKGLFSLDDVVITEMYQYVFMTFQEGNGYQGGTLWEEGDADKIERRASGLPVDARLIDDLYHPKMILFTLDTILDPDLTELAARLAYAQSILGEYIPEVNNWELYISAYGVRDTVAMNIQDVFEVEAVPPELEDTIDLYTWPLFIPGHTPLGEGILWHARADSIHFTLTDEDGDVVETRLAGDNFQGLSAIVPSEYASIGINFSRSGSIFNVATW